MQVYLSTIRTTVLGGTVALGTEKYSILSSLSEILSGEGRKRNDNVAKMKKMCAEVEKLHD